jgi:hypothetical protein
LSECDRFSIDDSTSGNGGYNLEGLVQQDQVGVVPGRYQPLAIPQPQQRGRRAGDRPQGAGRGASGVGHQVPQAGVQGDDSAGQGAILQPAAILSDRHFEVAKPVIAGRHAHPGHGVAHQVQSVVPRHLPDRFHQRRVHVHPVGDQPDRDPLVGQRGPGETRLAVVQGGHGVEKVSGVANAALDAGPDYLVAGQRMARADDDSARGQRLYEPIGFGQLRRQGNQSNAARGRPVGNVVEVRRLDIGFVMRPLLGRVDERPFEMQSERLRAAESVRRTLAQHRLSVPDEPGRRADDRRQEGGYPIAGQLAGHLPDAARVVGEIMAEGAVDLQVDTARRQRQPPPVDCLHVFRESHLVPPAGGGDTAVLDHDDPVFDPGRRC